MKTTTTLLKRLLFACIIGYVYSPYMIKAQCTGCTTTISTNTSTAVIVTSGQTLCIAPSVIMSGGMVINSGGKVCNQGIINNGIQIFGGGTLNNYGNIDSSGISNWGLLNNYGSINGYSDTSEIGRAHV